MKSKLRGLRRPGELANNKMNKNIEDVVIKVIERKMRRSNADFNLFARTINNQSYRNSGRNFFGLMYPSHSDSGFSFGQTSGQIFTSLAQSIQKAILRNL